MKLIKMLFIITSFLVFLSINRELLYSQEVDDSVFSSALPIVYLRDGEGIFVYDFLTKKSRCIQKCSFSNQAFFRERLMFFKDYIIFGMYDSNKGYNPYGAWEEEYYIVNKNGGEARPYSTLVFKEKSKSGFTLSLTENLYSKDIPSVFGNFPLNIELIISKTEGSPQLQALFKNIDNKCVFAAHDEVGTGDKTIRLLDLETNKIKTILKFHGKQTSIVHGGGGYDFPYLLNENELVFAEFPREYGPLNWLGIGLCKSFYFKKLNLKTNEVIIIDKLEGSATYPKISPCGKFIVYSDDKDIIWIKDIEGERKIKIGKGHTPFWLK